MRLREFNIIWSQSQFKLNIIILYSRTNRCDTVQESGPWDLRGPERK